MREGKFVGETILDEELRKKINGKVGMDEASAIFRRKNVPISEDDLTTSLRTKIQSGGIGGGIGGGGSYDDTDLRTRVQELEIVKADKTDLSMFRKVNEKISKNDLDPAYADKVENDIVKNKSDIHNLEVNKAEASELANYRAKNIRVALNDLSDQLQTLILGIDPELSGVSDVAIEAIKNYYGDKIKYSELVKGKVGTDYDSLIDIVNYIFDNFHQKDTKIKPEEIEDTFIASLVSANNILKDEIKSDVAILISSLENEKMDVSGIVAKVEEIASESREAIEQNNTSMLEKTTAITENASLLDEKITQLRQILNSFINSGGGDSSYTEAIDSIISRVIEVEKKSNTNATALEEFIALSDAQHSIIEDKITQKGNDADALSVRITGLGEIQNGYYNEFNSRINNINETITNTQEDISMLRGDIEVIKIGLENLVSRVDELTGETT